MSPRTTRARASAGSPRRESPGLEMTTGRTTGVSDRLAELEGRLAELERDTSLRARGRGMLHRIMPPEASAHFRNAGREQLLGIRSIVDFWIRRIDASESDETPPRQEIEIE